MILNNESSFGIGEFLADGSGSGSVSVNVNVNVKAKAKVKFGNNGWTIGWSEANE